MPVVAILRGVEPHEAVPIGRALAGEGFGILEVPMNSPDALRSIRLLADAVGSSAIVGAGTVLTAEDVDRVAEAGGKIIVSPNFDEQVVRRTKALGLISVPGVATPTEAFAAVRCGADALKAFPGEQFPPKIIKAWCMVLPPQTRVFPTGGVTLENMKDYLDAGASGFGVGTSLYKAGDSVEVVRSKAAAFSAQVGVLFGPPAKRAKK
eukprot:CAMPEP_0176259176 /NCGR_PEP_ID=MMETSP0121_2-20121125/38940_1 /TAXON_ID=160619 /ORGANISM="Kryptoperidinium foliaceum, Strain CCMP 1326" /LENGTH=207 /DNA_ID=CAMNT_0017599063 /DNA_START=17 /DNA_END=640 /DNA_ORIENTATION=-